MEEKSVARKFGDEQSALLDLFERRSFEMQLSRAVLGRSLSEPGTAAVPQAAAAAEVGRGRRGSGFKRALKKLLSPVLLGKKGGSARRGGGGGGGAPDPVSLSWSTFSTSLRR